MIPDDSTANLNVIIKNIQSGERDTIENVVFDLRAMIDASKTFVQGQGESQKEWLQTISCFESGLLKILLDDAFGRNGALKSEE